MRGLTLFYDVLDRRCLKAGKKKNKRTSPSISSHTFWRTPGKRSSPQDASFYAPDDTSGRRTRTLSSVPLASNLFLLSACCPAADSERYFVEDYFAVAAVFGAEIQANSLQCKTAAEDSEVARRCLWVTSHVKMVVVFTLTFISKES